MDGWMDEWMDGWIISRLLVGQLNAVKEKSGSYLKPLMMVRLKSFPNFDEYTWLSCEGKKGEVVLSHL